MALFYVAHQLLDTVDAGKCMNPVASKPGHDTVPVMWIQAESC